MNANPTTLPGLLLGIALLAACSEHSATTAPSADAVGLAPAGFIGDRSYTWDLKCSGDFGSEATWSWTASGVPIDGTSVSASCSPGQTSSGNGVRPATADGLSATVNHTSQSWTFDPAGSFKTHLKGSFSEPLGPPDCDPFDPHPSQRCLLTATATLTVDS